MTCIYCAAITRLNSFMRALVNTNANANEIGAFDTIWYVRHPRNYYLLDVWYLPRKYR